MDVVLEALEVHGHGRDVEPATAAAVPSSITIPRRTMYIVWEEGRNLVNY